LIADAVGHVACGNAPLYVTPDGRGSFGVGADILEDDDRVRMRR
jgi:hypothetical protein